MKTTEFNNAIILQSGDGHYLRRRFGNPIQARELRHVKNVQVEQQRLTYNRIATSRFLVCRKWSTRFVKESFFNKSIISVTQMWNIKIAQQCLFHVFHISMKKRLNEKKFTGERVADKTIELLTLHSNQKHFALWCILKTRDCMWMHKLPGFK